MVKINHVKFSILPTGLSTKQSNGPDDEVIHCTSHIRNAIGENTSPVSPKPKQNKLDHSNTIHCKTTMVARSGMIAHGQFLFLTGGGRKSAMSTPC